jgi:hypothetical protein
MHIANENAVLHRAATLLPKHKIDTVAQYADHMNIYVMLYDSLKDQFHFSDGEVYSTSVIMVYMKTLELIQRGVVRG